MAGKRLAPQALRWKCTPPFLSFYRDPKKFVGMQGIVGQERALRALHTGLRLGHSGYNIYVAGMVGTGRTTTIRRTLEGLELPCQRILDRCYVYNFANPSEPMLLSFSRGQGSLFRDGMKEVVRVLRSDMPKTLESSQVTRERDRIVERFQLQERKLFEEFAKKLKAEGFALIQIQEGTFIAPTIFPIIGDEAVSLDHLEGLVKDGKLSIEERQKILVRHADLSHDLKRVLTVARNIGKGMHQALDELQRRWGTLILDGVLDELRQKFSEPKVLTYLDQVKAHILENLDLFLGKERDAAPAMMVMPTKPEDPFWYYEVNLLHEPLPETESKCSIVEENNPSYVNLFGAIEYNIGPGGVWTTDFRHIKAGSLLRADGGYLIVNALDILRKPFVWDHLKRVLKDGKLVIQQPEAYFQLAPLALKPEPIELRVKVIMIGPDWLYQLLWNYEEEFAKTFKILSEFDTSIVLTKKNARDFAAVLKSICDRGDLLPLSAAGLAAMIEHGVEESGQRDRLSTRFTNVSDVLREASSAALSQKVKAIDDEHVKEAIRRKRDRHGLTEERVQRLIDEGVILVDTRGQRVGQVNGLAVYSLGHTKFGKPSRITAVTSVGKAGIINVEREAHLSGPTHDKGVLILTGYLRHKYAQKFPINLSASLAFEQSYSGVDGDSASSTEIYALLSSFSGAPIAQGIGVTGSVNQFGDIQPIGGANEKIEGFFDVCKAQGLTGKQGVIIPAQNERHLMLREDVVEAVRKKKFHLYSIRSIDEGIEILTGVKAGAPNRKGIYPPKSIHGRVMQRLRDMAANIEAHEEMGEEWHGHDGDEKAPVKPPEPPRNRKKSYERS